MTKAAAQAPTGHELFEGRPILLDTSTTPRDAYNEVHRVNWGESFERRSARRKPSPNGIFARR